MEILGFLNPAKWIEKAVRYFRRARFHIYFDPDETFHTRKLVDLNMELGHFVHVMVENSGAEVARGCSGQLIRIERMVEGRDFERHPGFVNPVVLKWAHESDLGPRDIDPDIPRRLDLCVAIQPDPQYFSLMTDRTPSGNQIDFPPGTYRATVRVRAENAASEDGTFQIVYEGIWNEFAVVQVSDS
jgi:hypothetical protein